MAEYVEIKHVDNFHIVINSSETRREEVQQENMRLREENRNLKSQVRQLRQSSEGDDNAERTHHPPNAPRRAPMRPVPRL